MSWTDDLPTGPIPNATEGERTPDRLLRSAALAAFRWEAIEQMSAAIFMLLCETQSRAALGAYATVTASQARSKMLREAWAIWKRRHRPDSVKADRLDKLFKEISEAAAIRNKIVHGLLVVIDDETVITPLSSNFTECAPNSFYAIAPSVISSRFQKDLAPNYIWSAKVVEALAAYFDSLAARIAVALAHDIGGTPQVDASNLQSTGPRRSRLLG